MKYNYVEPVEAEQLWSDTRSAICKWLNDGVDGDVEDKTILRAWYYESNAVDDLYVETEHGVKTAKANDWIVLRKIGEIEVYDNQTFLSLFKKRES